MPWSVASCGTMRNARPERALICGSSRPMRLLQRGNTGAQGSTFRAPLLGQGRFWVPPVSQSGGAAQKSTKWLQQQQQPAVAHSHDTAPITCANGSCEPVSHQR